MTRNDVRKIIKIKHLNHSAEKVLLRILDLTFRRDKDDPELMIETTSKSLQKAARVQERQLRNVLNQLEADGLLVNVETGKHVRCRLNVEAINNLPLYEPTDPKDEKADRAQKAREQRAFMREFMEFDKKVGDALNKDLAEFAIGRAKALGSRS